MMLHSTRRRFLQLLGLSGFGASLFAQEQPSTPANSAASEKPLLDSPPVLQCPTENSIAVVWAVNALALGAVRFGTDKNHLDQIAFGDHLGLKAMHERVLPIRLQSLKPNTRYFYQTETTPFIYHHSHRLEAKEPVMGKVYSFTTPSAERDGGSFAVINDTHSKQPTLKKLAEKLEAVGADFTVWNGDLVDAFDHEDMAVASVLRPGDSEFATEKPMLFVPGNHDYRGRWARNIERVLPSWEHSAPEDRRCSRNFLVRTGPVALIGLDTGEDKPDAHHAWAGHVRFEPYIEEQRDWLARTLKTPAAATAPFIVAFCHIPLFSSRPNANPGDQLDGYATWKRLAMNLWGPLLTQHGVQLVVSAHNHRFSYNAAAEDRSWAQLVGGGPNLDRQVTVIHGNVAGDELEVIADNIANGEELGRWRFAKRKMEI